MHLLLPRRSFWGLDVVGRNLRGGHPRRNHGGRHHRPDPALIHSRHPLVHSSCDLHAIARPLCHGFGKSHLERPTRRAVGCGTFGTSGAPHPRQKLAMEAIGARHCFAPRRHHGVRRSEVPFQVRRHHRSTAMDALRWATEAVDPSGPCLPTVRRMPHTQTPLRCGLGTATPRKALGSRSFQRRV